MLMFLYLSNTRKRKEQNKMEGKSWRGGGRLHALAKHPKINGYHGGCRFSSSDCAHYVQHYMISPRAS